MRIRVLRFGVIADTEHLNNPSITRAHSLMNHDGFLKRLERREPLEPLELLELFELPTLELDCSRSLEIQPYSLGHTLHDKF